MAKETRYMWVVSVESGGAYQPLMVFFSETSANTWIQKQVTPYAYFSEKIEVYED